MKIAFQRIELHFTQWAPICVLDGHRCHRARYYARSTLIYFTLLDFTIHPDDRTQSNKSPRSIRTLYRYLMMIAVDIILPCGRNFWKWRYNVISRKARIKISPPSNNPLRPCFKTRIRGAIFVRYHNWQFPSLESIWHAQYLVFRLEISQVFALKINQRIHKFIVEHLYIAAYKSNIFWLKELTKLSSVHLISLQLHGFRVRSLSLPQICIKNKSS